MEVRLLPFLKAKSSSAILDRAPDEQPEEENDPNAPIQACAQDLINAIHAKDVAGAAEAIKSAFEILDSMPHEEGPHIEPHSYDASKQE